MGSIFAARRAGTKLASNATTTSKQGIANKVMKSVALILNRRLLRRMRCQQRTENTDRNTNQD